MLSVHYCPVIDGDKLIDIYNQRYSDDIIEIIDFVGISDHFQRIYEPDKKDFAWADEFHDERRKNYLRMMKRLFDIIHENGIPDKEVIIEVDY